MINKKIMAIGLVSLALMIVVGCGKKEYKTMPADVTEPTTQNTTDTTMTDDKTMPVATDTATDDTSMKKEETKTQTPTTKPATDPAPKEEVKKEEPKKEEPKPTPKPMSVSSPAFSYGGTIPTEYTCKGTDVNPQINISNVPEGTKSIALVMDDPDAPVGTWDHWILFNIDPKTTIISKNSVPTGAKYGYNSWGKESYGGPCPPSGTHRYFIKVYALSDKLSGATYNGTDLVSAMSGKILKQVSTMGKFSK